MTRSPSVTALRDIQTLFDTGTASGLTDRQLLERFSSRRDPSSDAAFEVLVLRHGPMVLRVCRNMLHDEADAADAFQATFLVLVRGRGSIRKLESVGGWLYGVACRVAGAGACRSGSPPQGRRTGLVARPGSQRCGRRKASDQRLRPGHPGGSRATP